MGEKEFSVKASVERDVCANDKESATGVFLKNLPEGYSASVMEVEEIE